MSPIILLDFWGVVGVVQTPADVVGMADRIGAPADDFAAAYWSHRPFFDAGGSRTDYWRRVAADLDVSLDRDTIADLGALDVRSWSGVHPEMLALIAELGQQGQRLALLSNAPSDLVGHASAVLNGLVPELLFSSDLGHAKPDPRIFELTLERLNAAGDEVVFVDDNPDNVAAARAAGMRAILHTSVSETRDTLLAMLAR